MFPTSDVKSTDEYDDSSDDDSTVTDSGGNMGKDIFDDSHEIEDEDIPNPQMDNNNNANNGQSQCEKVAQKTVQTVTSLCKNYKHTGRIIDMDNLYSSPLVFIKLKEMSLYTRGTV